jgi:Fe-S cluster assembly iron-binding protein IscA
MALDESTNDMDKLESNGVTAYIDRRLNQFLADVGDINIDYVSNDNGPSGYRVVIGDKKCGTEGCSC